METDPYLPPVARLDGAMATAVEEVRNEHLRHEVQLRSVGSVHWLGAGLLVLMALLMLGFATQGATSRIETASIIFIAVAFVVAVGLVALGWGYRAFAPWVRWPGSVVSALALFAFPIGTIIGVWTLSLVWCAKGRRVLAADYAEVRRLTPHLQFHPTFGDRIANVVMVSVMLGLLGILLRYW